MGRNGLRWRGETGHRVVSTQHIPGSLGGSPEASTTIVLKKFGFCVTLAMQCCVVLDVNINRPEEVTMKEINELDFKPSFQNELDNAIEYYMESSNISLEQAVQLSSQAVENIKTEVSLTPSVVDIRDYVQEVLFPKGLRSGLNVQAIGLIGAHINAAFGFDGSECDHLLDDEYDDEYDEYDDDVLEGGWNFV